MARKPTIKGLKRKLWEAVKEYVRKRDNNQCQRCGKYVIGRQAETSHVIPKSHGNVLRFDPQNLKVLCFSCHRWWHANPTDSGAWFKKKYPQRWEYLQEKRHQIVKWKVEDYERMIDELRKSNT